MSIKQKERFKNNPVSDEIKEKRRQTGKTITEKRREMYKRRYPSYIVTNVDTGETETLQFIEWCRKYDVKPNNAYGSVRKGKYKNFTFIIV